MPHYVRGQSLGDLAKQDQSQENRPFFSRMTPKYGWRDIELHHALKRYSQAKQLLWQRDFYEENGRTPLHELWDLKLYTHQLEAFEQIAFQKQNVVIATGTGSGKTESFLLPLLCHLLTETHVQRSTPGVRALLLYPMNALVEDQMARLRRLLFWINLRAVDKSSDGISRMITFGRYTGQTPVNERDHNMERSVSEEEIHDLGELRYREEMQRQPPDILVTNFTMLEYMLLRNDDRALFSRPELLKFLVLDELHTYGGTVGMEVATLLRRLTQYVGKEPGTDFICVGTSATLGDGQKARRGMAEFASILFGSAFEETQIIVGKFHRREVPRESAPPLDCSALDFLTQLPLLAPHFSEAFALTHTGVEVDEIPQGEWKDVADLLQAQLDSQTLDGLSSADRSEALGTLLSRSNVFRALNNVLECCKEVFTLAELVPKVFASNVAADRRDEAQQALGVLLQLALAGRIQNRANLAVRAHMFVREFRQAFLCLNPSHKPTKTSSDGWWSELAFVHRNNCPYCTSLMYPLVLCRKCGFVLMEGWLRENKSVICPERDELLGAHYFRRVLFRPFGSLPGHIQADVDENEKRALLCTQCGIRFPGDHPEHQRAAVERHLCAKDCLVEIALWQAPNGDFEMAECPYCEQEWIKGQEVISYPHVSLYGAASVLIEELKREIDSPLQGTGLVNKLLCFSDGRQQAASIAARLQRINEDFTFRQVLYGVLGFDEGMNSRAVLAALESRIGEDKGLLNLFCEREEHDDANAVRKRMATHLLKETCSEYRTLESLGVTRVEVPKDLIREIVVVMSSDHFGRMLPVEDRESFAKTLIDWLFRSRRWAVHAGIQFFAEELQPLGFQDRCLMKFGESRSNISGFSLKQPNRRSHVYDYYQRICRKTGSSVVDGRLPLLKTLLERLWDDVICSSKFVSRQRVGLPTTESNPFIAIDGNGPDSYKLKLNWSSLKWRLVSQDAPLYVCDTCGVHTQRMTMGVCPVRECSGTLNRTTLHELLRKPFSPKRHYYSLLTSKAPKPLWIEEHTAQISPRARRDIEISFKNEEFGNVDVVSGSTTFEMGIDLGSVNAVFLANMPPEPANYRQRAGRAGRRAGMFPVVATYVRERPHDVYFWNRLDAFIAGPLRVPKLSQPSHEVLLRHANAAFYAATVGQMPGAHGLEGPPVGEFIPFALSESGQRMLKAFANDPTTRLHASLTRILAANPDLPITP